MHLRYTTAHNGGRTLSAVPTAVGSHYSFDAFALALYSKQLKFKII